jgi:hypothetical protein
MRFNEEKNIHEVYDYIKSTYGEHYTAGEEKHQLMDDIIEAGDGLAFNRWNCEKYIRRYGKKGGFNRKDLLKAIHYAILLMYHNDQLVAKEDPIAPAKSNTSEIVPHTPATLFSPCPPPSLTTRNVLVGNEG